MRRQEAPVTWQEQRRSRLAAALARRIAADCFAVRRGFTLIEVMISIFLVLLLIVGINQAFKVVSQTVGAGQALSSKTRDSFAAQTALTQEIGRSLVHDDTAPFLIIASRMQPAFRNKADAEADRDYDPNAYASDQINHARRVLSIDLNDDNREGDPNMPGENMSFVAPSHRNHRLDMLSFFGRDIYRRQTGNDENAVPKPPVQATAGARGYSAADSSFAADESSNCAWVVYGHLWLPKPNGTTLDWYLDPNANPLTQTNPGEGNVTNNPANFYASDWVLGRMAILLAEPFKPVDLPLETTMTWGNVQDVLKDWKARETSGGSGNWWNRDRPPGPPVDRSNNLLTAIDRPPFIAPPVILPLQTRKMTNFLPIAKWHDPSNPSSMPPADWSCVSWDPTPEYSIIESARYDVAIGSFKSFRALLTDTIERGQRFTDDNPGSTGNPRYLWRWWEPLIYRFRGNMKIPKPLSPAGVAQSQAMMIPHCTQFIVEFAGDFVAQEREYEYKGPAANKVDVVLNKDVGRVTGIYTQNPSIQSRTDGVIDFVMDKSADTSAQRDNVNSWIRKVRWYGFPRDVNGDGRIDAYPVVGTGNIPPTRPVENNDLRDVVPLRDVFMTYLEDTRNNDPDTNQIFTADKKRDLMAASFEKDISPYHNANYQGGQRWSWPNNIPQPPNTGGPAPADPRASDYRDSLNDADADGDGVADAIGARYIAAFGPTDDALQRIRMIRITMTLDDSNNRLGEGQVFQYVIGLP